MAATKKTVFIVIAVLAVLFFVVTFMAVVAAAFTEGDGDFAAGKSVGIVEVRGAIESPDEAVRQIKKYRDNGAIKAIVLRVESPGGGVAASQEILAALRKAREKKPVVCSMGEVAASGGYYIACGCDSIVANPGTLTGSIGVILEYPVLEELIRKIGVRFEVLKAGENKDLGNPFRQLTPAERQLLQAMLDDVHAQFIEAVAQGRRLPADSVKAFADGRVFTGRQALALGMVDRLGTLDDAVEMAGRMAGLKEAPKTVKEKKKRRSVFDLMDNLSESASQLKNTGVRLQFLLQ
jgi:protease-4